MNGRFFELPELGEELVDVGVGHAELEVADDQLRGPGFANDAASARSIVLMEGEKRSKLGAVKC